MKRILYPIIFILAITLYTDTARAADVWVSPNGSDNAPGTEAQPVRTLAEPITGSTIKEFKYEFNAANGRKYEYYKSSSFISIYA